MQSSDKMLRFGRVLVALFLCGVIAPAVAASGNMTGTVIVNITSDTAAAAKTRAMNQARRQIIGNVLSSYSMTDQLTPALDAAKSSELTPLIASTSIDGEQSSDTTYSANITMTLDRDAARAWLDEKSIQNWLSDGKNRDMFTMNITLSDRVADWADINRIARAENMEPNIVSIVGKSIVATLPAANRTGFTIALRDAGWRTADSDGTLMVSK